MLQQPKNPLDDFDPNAKPKAPFATYVPRRSSGAFKTHGTRASALNALSYHKVGILYTWDGHQWNEVCRFQPSAFRPTRCELCGVGLMEHPRAWSARQRAYVSFTDKPRINRGVCVFERKRGRLVEPLRTLVICQPCKRHYN